MKKSILFSCLLSLTVPVLATGGCHVFAPNTVAIKNKSVIDLGYNGPSIIVSLGAGNNNFTTKALNTGFGGTGNIARIRVRLHTESDYVTNALSDPATAYDSFFTAEAFYDAPYTFPINITLANLKPGENYYLTARAFDNTAEAVVNNITALNGLSSDVAGGGTATALDAGSGIERALIDNAGVITLDRDGTTAIDPTPNNIWNLPIQLKIQTGAQATGGVIVNDGSDPDSLNAKFYPFPVAISDESGVNTYTNSSQTESDLATNVNGDTVIVWNSNTQDGDGMGVYGQRYNSSGQRVGPEFKINTSTINAQLAPSVAMDDDGDFVVVWQGYQAGYNYDILGQRYDSSGNPVGGEFKVNTYTNNAQSFPDVSIDTDGDFVVVWQSYGQDLINYGIFGQRYDSNGNTVGSEFQINSNTVDAQKFPAVAVDDDGDFVVVWESANQDGSADGVYGQRYDSNGNPVGGEFKVNTYTTNSQLNPDVAIDSDGDFVVVWESYYQDNSFYGVYGQRYDSSGNMAGTEFRVNIETVDNQMFPAVAMASDGKFVVTWTSFGQDGDQDGVYSRAFRASGLPLGPEILINKVSTTGNQSFPKVGIDTSNDFFYTWTSENTDGSLQGIMAKFFRTPSITGISTVFLGGKFITFTTNRDGNSEIYRMRANGLNPVRLTNNAFIDSAPAWSPDGTKIAFSTYRDGNGEIYVMDADGTNPINLTNTAGNEGVPAWSHDGTKIAFVSDRDGNSEIYVMNDDGSNQTRLTNNAFIDSDPSWSPDGTQIAFSTNRDGNDEIYVMDADGNNQTNLTNSPSSDKTPSWSPDGTNILFATDRDGDNEIYIMDVNGINQNNLSWSSTFEELNPSWSPDGTQIGFTSNRDGNNEIYVMDADGINQTRVTNDINADDMGSFNPQ